MDKVSLVIPCYRDSATLPRAINSVLRQTRPVDEIIVVNDCSPESDAIDEIVASYPTVIYIKNSVNVGLAATRNAGAQVATGNVLAFLDADDELHPRKIEIQLNHLAPRTAVTTQVLRVYGASTRVATIFPELRSVKVREIATVDRMLVGNYLTGASIMIHRSYFSELHGYNEFLRSCEDFDLWLRLIESGGRVKNVISPLYIYHYNQSGLSSNYLNISHWELEVIKRHFARKKLVIESSRQAALVWGVWMVRHLIRCKAAGDAKLRAVTFRNIEMLAAHPLLIGTIKFADRLGFLRLASLLMRRK